MHSYSNAYINRAGLAGLIIGLGVLFVLVLLFSGMFMIGWLMYNSVVQFLENIEPCAPPRNIPAAEHSSPAAGGFSACQVLKLCSGAHARAHVRK